VSTWLSRVSNLVFRPEVTNVRSSAREYAAVTGVKLVFRPEVTNVRSSAREYAAVTGVRPGLLPLVDG
jgi:hypothetical protein